MKKFKYCLKETLLRSLIPILILLLSQNAFSQAPFKVYGFMDFGVIPYLSVANNNVLRTLMREDITVLMNGLNVYMDFQPNAYSRAMIESSYRVNNLSTIYDSDTNYFRIERAWIEGIYNDQIKVRAGRFITPAGIWNVDHGSPIITSVSAPIQSSWFPIFPTSQIGMMVHGTFFVGDHDLIYNIYNSTGSNVNNRLRNIEDIAWGGHLELKMDLLDQFDIGASAMTGMRREDQLIPVVYKLDNAIAPESQDQWFFDDDTLNHREVFYGAQVKAQMGKFGFQGEINNKHIYNILEGWKHTDFYAWYVLGRYTQPLTESLNLTPYLMYEKMDWARPQYGSPELNQIPISGWWTIVAGLNLGIHSNMHLKLEFNFGRPVPKPLTTQLGAPIYNQYETGDLDVITIGCQFTMAF